MVDLARPVTDEHAILVKEKMQVLAAELDEFTDGLGEPKWDDVTGVKLKLMKVGETLTVMVQDCMYRVVAHPWISQM